MAYQRIKFSKYLVLVTISLILIGCSIESAICGSLSQSPSSDRFNEFEENSKTLETLKADLEKAKFQWKKTQKALAELITTLLNDNVGNVMLGEENRRAKRATSSSEDDDYDDILGHLPISALSGLRGRDGRDGRDGKDGAQGLVGSIGPQGVQGATGLPGKDGKDGEKGAAGPQGRDGRDGADGKDGVDGTDGLTGRDGLQGNDGNPGTPGVPGEAGQRGPSGSPGEAGKDGDKGSPGVNGIAGRDCEPGADRVTGSSGRSQVDVGAVYTRWGRTTCENPSTLLYHGFAGGSRSDQTGGGVNYQCMPLIPEYNIYNTGITSIARMAGSEYQTLHFGIFPNSAHDSNVPCARCYTNGRSAVMLIPAKRNCPQGWNKEYEGYLMSESDTHFHPSTFECVDAHPEYISATGNNTNGALFYFISAICSGSGNTLHCPPYDASKQLTCVICSR